MRTLVILAAAVLLRASSVTANTPTLPFCTCRGPSTARAGLRAADAVFVGRVLRIDTLPGGFATWSPPAVRATVSVDRSWKGIATSSVEVVSGTGGGDCSFWMEVGKAYLFYAGKPGDGPLGVAMCSRTEHLARARADIRALGRPIYRSRSRPGSGGLSA